MRKNRQVPYAEFQIIYEHTPQSRRWSITTKSLSVAAHNFSGKRVTLLWIHPNTTSAMTLINSNSDVMLIVCNLKMM